MVRNGEIGGSEERGIQFYEDENFIPQNLKKKEKKN
jgi:hypothetical protein